MARACPSSRPIATAPVIRCRGSPTGVLTIANEMLRHGIITPRGARARPGRKRHVHNALQTLSESCRVISASGPLLATPRMPARDPGPQELTQWKVGDCNGRTKKPRRTHTHPAPRHDADGAGSHGDLGRGRSVVAPRRSEERRVGKECGSRWAARHGTAETGRDASEA